MAKISFNIDEINKIVEDYFKSYMNVKSVTYFYDEEFTEGGWDMSKCHFEVVELIENDKTKEITEQTQYISYEKFINVLKHHYKYNNIDITRIRSYKDSVEIDYKKEKTLKKYKTLY